MSFLCLFRGRCLETNVVSEPIAINCCFSGPTILALTKYATIGWSKLHLISRLLVELLSDPDEYATICRTNIVGRKRRTMWKLAPVLFHPPKIPHNLNTDRTRAAAVGSLRTTAWPMAHNILCLRRSWMPKQFLSFKWSPGEQKWIFAEYKSCNRLLSLGETWFMTIKQAVKDFTFNLLNLPGTEVTVIWF
jgi:hypothetical protein